MNADQHPYEPPRTTAECKNRAARVKALGNAVVPQQVYPLFLGMAELAWAIREDDRNDA